MKAPILLGAAMLAAALAVPSATTAPFTTSPSCSQSPHPQGVACAAGRLKITKGGTPDRPLTYAGQGRQVSGIDVETDNVIVDGYTMDGPKAPGIEIHGSNVTVQNTTVKAPKGDDGDGIRFFGDNIRILHNTISDTDNSTGAHADCTQTFATDDEDFASKNVDIENNRCERIDNMCLMAEGPNSEAGDGTGKGVSEDWTFKGTYCETRQASQTVMVDDVQNPSPWGPTPGRQGRTTRSACRTSPPARTSRTTSSIRPSSARSVSTSPHASVTRGRSRSANRDRPARSGAADTAGNLRGGLMRLRTGKRFPAKGICPVTHSAAPRPGAGARLRTGQAVRRGHRGPALAARAHSTPAGGS
ncbi:right-handed parallel beta-helix repeat-containing protein [Amycolatopsis panacis]|uniref:hypothetical protein n=1 Tax=Amycolatopsis panacis TaxID=2340917 RepID=UPI0011C3FCAB|nr:hypothetical protein [Amycolatopsis panacis]